MSKFFNILLKATAFFYSLFLFAACNKEQGVAVPNKELFKLLIPTDFPAINYPADNVYTYDRWLLGKKLFYDKALSRTSTVSCGSCHQTAFAMADNASLSRGVEGRIGTRNTPTLANLAYQPYFTSDGGVPTLEMQVLVPIQEHNEFDFNIIDIQNRLESNNEYQALSKKAYNRNFDYYVITRALANFERTLLSGNSKYDLAKRKEANLTAQEARGFDLFTSSRTNCSICHSGLHFTNYLFENNGLYANYKDIGRKRLTNLDTDLAKFKVPTLRNIALTAPYMHDGSLATLKDVVAHYNTGGIPHQSKSNLIKPLQLSSEEMNDMIAFLETLTDLTFTQNEHLKNQ